MSHNQRRKKSPLFFSYWLLAFLLRNVRPHKLQTILKHLKKDTLMWLYQYELFLTLFRIILALMVVSVYSVENGAEIDPYSIVHLFNQRFSAFSMVIFAKYPKNLILFLKLRRKILKLLEKLLNCVPWKNRYKLFACGESFIFSL